MSDPTSPLDAGPGRLPAVTLFQPSAEGAAALDVQPRGTLVLLLVSDEDLGWAADAAIALSTAWARSGRRIVLADLHLENPTLHERLGAPNLEGVTDVFLYGASIARSARPVRGRGFYLISSGTYEPDADAIYAHPRWPKLVAGFRDAGATLLLFAPRDGADLDALSRWTDQAVLLGAPGAPGTLDPLLAGGVAVEAVLAPPRREAPPPEAASGGQPDDRDLLLPPAPQRPAPAEAPRSRLWVVALVILLALLAWAGFVLARNRPDLLGGDPNGAARTAAVAPAGDPAGDAPGRAGEALPYSVQVKAFNSFPAARQEVAAQEGRLGDTPLFISPEEVQGMLYFKVMAGLAPDTAAANRLQARLLEAGAVDAEDAADAWSLIRPTPLAFDLGDFPDRGEAATRADSLLALEIPSYAVVMPYSDGSSRWQLYGGAYADSASADAMRRRLIAAGVQPRLVLRLGGPPGEERPAGP